MSQLPSEAVSELLVKWRAGDEQALQALIPLVYKELHDLAHHYLRRERSGHTLQTTALVHEAYLRLVDQKPLDVENRAHFVGVAARLMRQILVDYARSHRAAKRGPDRKVELEVALPLPQKRNADVVAVDDALKSLEQVDEQQSRIVELRFFGGLTTEEAAEVLGISRSTAKRELECGESVVIQADEERQAWTNRSTGEKLKKLSARRWSENPANGPRS